MNLDVPLQREALTVARFLVEPRGKSGQLRVPYFLTGRDLTGNRQVTESATENYRPEVSG